MVSNRKLQTPYASCHRNVYDVYLGLTAAGYDMANPVRASGITKAILATRWGQPIVDYFGKARTEDGRLNPYWPRASILVRAITLWVLADHASGTLEEWVDSIVREGFLYVRPVIRTLAENVDMRPLSDEWLERCLRACCEAASADDPGVPSQAVRNRTGVECEDHRGGVRANGPVTTPFTRTGGPLRSIPAGHGYAMHLRRVSADD